MRMLIIQARAHVWFHGGAIPRPWVMTLAGVLAIVGSHEQHSPLVSNAWANMPAAAELTDDECLEFARSLEASVEEFDPGAFSDLIDWGSMVAAATDNLGFPEQVRRKFSQGMLESVSSQFADQIIGQVAAGGDYRFIRVREMDGQKTVLFRMIVESGMNYHEWLLTKSEDEVIAADVHIYLAGERMSQMMRRSALPVARRYSRSLLAKLVLGESAYIKHIDEILKMTEGLREGRYNEVQETYAQLPAVLQRDKQILLLRHQAAMRTSEDDLLSAIEDFRRHHPDDACLDFILIDYYALREEHDKTLASIDRLDDSVGGDPYLNALRAETVFKMGDVSKAFELVDDAIQRVPAVSDVYWMSVGLALMAEDHPRTLKGLQVIEERFEIDLTGVLEMPEYAEFLQSPQGKEWSTQQASQRAGDDGR